MIVKRVLLQNKFVCVCVREMKCVENRVSDSIGNTFSVNIKWKLCICVISNASIKPGLKH